MMRLKNNILLAFSILLLSSSLMAQQELGLHFLRNTWQSSKTNPAFITENKAHYGLPNLYYNLSHSGPTYNEVVRSENGESTLDIDRLITNLGDNNQLLTNLELETTSASFGIKNVRFSFNHAFKLNAFMDYPKELVEVSWQGNGQFIDQTINVGPDFQVTAYNEFGFGAAFKILGVGAGARVKLLTGIGDASTDRTDISLYTNPDIYQLSLTTDYNINTSSFLAYNGRGDFDLSFGELSFDRLFSANTGIALDLGASFTIKNLEISASVIDLGFINWKSNVRNFESKGSVSYDGLDFSEIVNDENINFSETIDTLETIFEFKETSNSYRTNLPTKAYLSATYKMGKMWEFGGLFYSESFRGEFYPAAAFSARAHLGNIASVGIVYAVRNETYDNIGLNATIKLGPVQLFAVTDNILAAIQPYDSHNANGRIGINMIFK